ncbi:MAG TPA: efflux RND transporter periplasmic adaptor subunit, partial [Bacteroidota bacterium]|nr:efflux RND transporter periplasmic adaptor subunit [Bacteroidota bacterium]
MSTGQFDLSKLKIDREKEDGGRTTRSSRTSYLLYGAGALFLILVAFFFIKNTFGDEEVVDITTVSMISPSQASALLTASGYVVAQTKASIASKATGRLVYLGFKEGDQVKKGEIIARIESADVEAAVHQAKADLDVAIADKNSAEQTLRRTQELLNRQLASQADYDAAKAQYDRVIATIASREANLNSMQVSLESTNIRAPFDGTILTKNADIGEVVAPFGAGASSRVAVVTIADMGSLEVEADVSESNIEKVSTGQPCEISLDAYPEKNYRGVVDKIIPTADRAKATILTKVRFLERDNRVLPEMSAKVHFLDQQSAQSESTTPA